MRAHVIRVTGSAPAVRFVVLAPDSGQALAAVIPGLGLCDIAEVTGEVLPSSDAVSFTLEPSRPVRLP